MKKIKPEVIAPLCDRCQTPMIVIGQVWECKNKLECGGMPIPYQGKKKVVNKKVSLPYKD